MFWSHLQESLNIRGTIRMKNRITAYLTVLHICCFVEHNYFLSSLNFTGNSFLTVFTRVLSHFTSRLTSSSSSFSLSSYAISNGVISIIYIFSSLDSLVFFFSFSSSSTLEFLHSTSKNINKYTKTRVQ